MKLMLLSLLVLLTLVVHGSSESSKYSPNDGCVTVSGVTGYVAGHVVEVLLSEGFTVHGTVRSLKSKTNDFLHDLAKKYPKAELKLFEADIRDDNAFDEAAKGCFAFMHVASPVITSDDPQVMVDTAVAGTLNALKVVQANKMKKIVITSSVASIAPTKKKLASGEEYNEKDWNDVATLTDGTYSYSKAVAEKAAIDFMDKLGSNKPFEFATIHFPFALGPQQNPRVTSSNTVVKLMLNGELPFVLPMRINVVDIRDVARAHVEVMKEKKAEGRFIVAFDSSKSSYSLLELANVMRDIYPTFPVPNFELPLQLALLLAKFDNRIDAYMLRLSSEFGRKHPGFDGSRLTKELGFKYEHTNVRQILKEAGDSMFDLKVVDGEINLHPALKALPAFGLLIMALIFGCLMRCCKSSAPAPTKQKKN